ncbi:MAG: prepilin-type N-terminal cleavage/methylation domain-containing protein [Smithellaceae bacterium]|nr:prepilin-type N-terminal cleavage/methylation domain-containing protein [Smithellaceae bacterium]
MFYFERQNRGFTLIEILVVLVLMSLILGISAAMLTNALSGAKHKAAAREIVATLKYAKHLAAAKNEKQIVQFDLDDGNYGIKGRRVSRIPEKTKIAIYESDLNAEPLTAGKYNLACEATGVGQWSRIGLFRDNQVIIIKSDPVMTALIVDTEDDHHE